MLNKIIESAENTIAQLEDVKKKMLNNEVHDVKYCVMIDSCITKQHIIIKVAKDGK
jgi:phosphoribosyl-ATP pyrophosphohydrolase